MTRKIVCAGETIMDILFKNNRPIAAVPGGSSFNCLISLARSGIPAYFVGEAGEDLIGNQIADFLKENNIHTDYFVTRKDIRTAVSLAYLNENNDANYMFYKDPPTPNPDFTVPHFQRNDILIFGSYYAICPALQKQVSTLRQKAADAGCIIYYDINFRKSHRAELESLLPNIQDNFSMADIVRGSADDFQIMYGCDDAETIYRKYIRPFCSLFICTHGASELKVCTPDRTLSFKVPKLETVSTIGAGDNFNAGFNYGLMRYGIRKETLPVLSESQWNKLIECGLYFASNVCQSLYNSIDPQLDLSRL